MRDSRKVIVVFFISLLLVLPTLGFSQTATTDASLEKYSFGLNSRDPFVPLVSRNGLILIPRETDVTNMELGGIIYSEEESVAIINNEVVKIGDMIGEYKVLTIERRKVILEKNNQGFTLELEE
ncbi:MAG: general secretion pathway protein GspB [Candidatus Omnitrophica bacterium]|nr:general secretion pathway protein GspB [Candidatus Omnitrophota bacterium]